MAKHTAPAAKRREAAHKRQLKRVNKKFAKMTKIPKKGVLGMVNGFTVTRLEPNKRVAPIFPECADSPAAEPKQVTFAWTAEADQDDDSRAHRTNTRRTHTDRDSSVDSLIDADASRDSKRRRTNESDIVEDAEARKATRSMRHSKSSLEPTTTAEPSEPGCSPSKRVFPRTPKPDDRRDTSANDTFEDSSCRNDDGEGVVEPKVSLASLFDEETNVEDGGDQVSACAEEKSLNSAETTLDPQVVDLPDVTAVRVRSNEEGESAKMDGTLNENAENASGAPVPAPTGEVELSMNPVDGAAPGTKETKPEPVENIQTDPSSVSQTKADSTTPATPLDGFPTSRPVRRDSSAGLDNLEEDDVLKQRRSQISPEEEEPMEISVINAVSRLPTVPTPSPKDERDDNTVSNAIVPSMTAEFVQPTAEFVESTAEFVDSTAEFVDSTAEFVESTAEFVESTAEFVESTAEFVESAAEFVESTAEFVESTAEFVESAAEVVESRVDVEASTGCEAPGKDPEQDFVETPVASNATFPQNTNDQQPLPEIPPTGPDSGTSQIKPSDTDERCDASSEEDEYLWLRALSCRIKNTTERDESRDNAKRELTAPEEAEPDEEPRPNSLHTDEPAPVTESSQISEGESTLAIVPEGNSVAAPGTNSPDASLASSAAVPPGQTRLTYGERTSVRQRAALPPQSCPVSDILQLSGDALVPSTPDLLTSNAVFFFPDAVPSGECDAAMGVDAGDLRQADVTSQVRQGHEADVEHTEVLGAREPDCGDVTCRDPPAAQPRSEETTADGTDNEAGSGTSETLPDSNRGVTTREKRTRRPTKRFSPPRETTATPSSARKKAAPPKSASKTPVAATPRQSRRLTDLEEGAAPMSNAKNEKKPARRAEKTAAAKPKTPRRSAAASKALETAADENMSSTETAEADRNPKTTRRAAGSKTAGARTVKTPATASKATAAASSSKTRKSEKRSPTDTLSPSEGSKSVVKASKT